jgi:hypothetical protein
MADNHPRDGARVRPMVNSSRGERDADVALPWWMKKPVASSAKNSGASGLSISGGQAGRPPVCHDGCPLAVTSKPIVRVCRAPPGCAPRGSVAPHAQQKEGTERGSHPTPVARPGRLGRQLPKPPSSLRTRRLPHPHPRGTPALRCPLEGRGRGQSIRWTSFDARNPRMSAGVSSSGTPPAALPRRPPGFRE